MKRKEESKQKKEVRVDKGEKKRRKEKKKRNRTERKEKRKKREKRKMSFFRHSDGRISTVRDLKSIHTTRAMRGYQNLGVSSNFTR